MTAYVGVGIKVDESHTSAKFELGEVKMTSDGREWIYVEADAAIDQYAACVVHNDYGITEASDTTAAVGTGSGKMVCVPQVAIASGSFGWGCIRCNGDASVLHDALCAAYTQLYTSATAGVVSDSADADVTIAGLVLTEAGTTGDTSSLCKMDHPYIYNDLII